MKKIFFTMFTLIVGLGVSDAADVPFMKLQKKSKVQEKMEAHRKHLPLFSQLSANQRVSNVTPDSVTMYEHDGVAWSMMFTGKLTYNASAQPTRFLLHTPPPLSFPFGEILITYNAAGKLTSFQQNLLFPTPSVEYKLEQRFDANQNLTSVKYYENDNGSLVLTGGDSALYAYNGSTITSVELSYFDGFMANTWVKTDKLTGLSFNANNQVSAATFQYWDAMGATWSTEMLKYANLQWGLGYLGFEALIGMPVIDFNDFFAAVPSINNDYMLTSPTNYIEWIVDGSLIDTLSRATSTLTSGRISQVLSEEYAMGVWEPSYRTNYVYNSSNVVVTATEQDFDGLTWSDNYRYEWDFDAQNNLTKEEEWYFNGVALELGYGQTYEYLYTANNVPFQVIYKYWNGMAYEFSEKNVYNFGSFSTGTAEIAHASLRVYPNPVKDALNIQLSAKHTSKLEVEVIGVSGQVVSKQQFDLNSGLNQVQISTQQWQAGVYLVKIRSAAGFDVVRIVK
jgi:hypothetical protein